MEDDFEYDIRFSTKSTISLSEREDSVTSKENLDIISIREPVIVLLGWGGCKERHLAKYSSVYGRYGCTTLMYIAPVKMLLSPNSRKMLLSNAKKLVNLLDDMNFFEQPLFFHIFSNGGALMYDLIREILTKKGKIHHVNGCIFDSGPAEMKFSHLCRMLANLIPGNTFNKYYHAIIIYVRFYLTFIFNWVISFFIENQTTLQQQSVWHSLVNEPNNCPQLFLYSKTDEVCDYYSIQKFIMHRQRKDVLVNSFMWDVSPHVSHMRSYPRHYERLIINFISRNLD